MSLWSRLFGRGEASDAVTEPKPVAEADHGGFTILATPFKAENGQFQTAGTVRKEIDGTVREHRFVRADRFGSLQEAADFALVKGRQIVNEQGERLFR